MPYVPNPIYPSAPTYPSAPSYPSHPRYQPAPPSDVTVAVHAGLPIGTVPTLAGGTQADYFDPATLASGNGAATNCAANQLNTTYATQLQQAGIQFLRWPGGSSCDAYHYANSNNHVSIVVGKWTAFGSPGTPGAQSGVQITLGSLIVDGSLSVGQIIGIDVGSAFETVTLTSVSGSGTGPYICSFTTTKVHGNNALITADGPISPGYIDPGNGLPQNPLETPVYCATIDSLLQVCQWANVQPMIQVCYGTASWTAYVANAIDPTAQGPTPLNTAATPNGSGSGAYTNLPGTLGGDPSEAAAYVSYVNVTKAAQGFPKCLYWEIGNEQYLAGIGPPPQGFFWNSPNSWPYLSADSAANATNYAAHAKEFIAAMKAVDPTIQCGVSLLNFDTAFSPLFPHWNENVLAVLGTATIPSGPAAGQYYLDFAAVHYFPETAGNEDDAQLLAITYAGPTSMVAGMEALQDTIANIAARPIPLFMNALLNSGSGPFGKQTLSIVSALQVADQYVTIWETGGAAPCHIFAHGNVEVDGNQSPFLYGNTAYGDVGIISRGGPTNRGVTPLPLNTPYPPYYGIKMVCAHFAAPGDTLVTATPSGSGSALLRAHACLRANGRLTILLLNEDPTSAHTVTITVSGYTPAPTVTRYYYDAAAALYDTASATNPSLGLSKDTIDGGGSGMVVTLPYYSMAVLEMTPA